MSFRNISYYILRTRMQLVLSDSCKGDAAFHTPWASLIDRCNLSIQAVRLIKLSKACRILTNMARGTESSSLTFVNSAVAADSWKVTFLNIEELRRSWNVILRNIVLCSYIYLSFFVLHQRASFGGNSTSAPYIARTWLLFFFFET